MVVLVDFWLATATLARLAGAFGGRAGSCADISLRRSGTRKMLYCRLAVDTPGLTERFKGLWKNTQATLDSAHCNDLRLEERFSVL